MALSLTSRPATWSAVKNPVVYKFATTGGPFTNYRIEVEVFDADDTSLTDGVAFSFSPDADGITYVDISTIIKSHLKAEWIKPSVLNEVETDTSLKFYIKYQELYDGSGTSVVDDSANPRYAVFGGLQIPSDDGNNLTDYVPEDGTKQFLIMFDNPKLWRGYPATLSCIFPDALNLYRSLKQYNEAGGMIGSEDQDALDTDNDDSVNRLDLTSGISAEARQLKLKLIAAGSPGSELLTNEGFLSSGSLVDPWVVVENGNNWSQTGGTNPALARLEVSFTAGAQSSDILQQDITEQTTGVYAILIRASAIAASANVTINAYKNGVFVKQLFNKSVFSSGSFMDFESTAIVSSAFDRIEVIASKDDAGSFTLGLSTVSLKKLAFEDYTEELTFSVVDPCKNPVMLFWKNSLGGDSFWLFEHDQEVSYNLSDSKAKRMILSANNLTANEWETLNELNHLGTVYKQNIIQLTSTVDKSHTRDGTQVYMVEKDGTKTGVIVIPTNNVMFTRMERHQFQIEIELPERYE